MTLLRQHISDRWEDEKGDITEADRTTIKENIVPSMTKCTDLAIMKSLDDWVHTIALEDYPHHWPGVLQQIGENIISDNVLVCYSSLCALKALVKKYQSELGRERANLLEITQNAFDILEPLFEKHLEIFDDSSILIWTVLTKIFYFANYVVVFLSNLYF